jgi:prevent-host-death family protein
MYYGGRMADVASRELRNNTRALLERVEAGETVTITVNGRPVARLGPIGARPRRMSREEFVRFFETSAADPGLTADLHELAPDTTDDLGDP